MPWIFMRIPAALNRRGIRHFTAAAGLQNAQRHQQQHD